jgi:branched-subunit amino acid transport protein
VAVTTWLVFLAVAVGTYVIRASMLVGLTGRQLPAAIQSRLALAGPAAIATLAVAALFSGSEGGQRPELLAGLAGFLAVRRTGNVTHAFLVGMPALWLLYVFGLR